LVAIVNDDYVGEIPVLASHGLMAVVVLDEYGAASLRLPRLRTEVDRVTDLLRGLGFAEDSDDLVGDGSAGALRDALARWRPLSRRAVFYWAGHGHESGDEFYLLCRNASDNLRVTTSEALTAREIGQRLALTTADRIVAIVDACHAGGGSQRIVAAFKTAVAEMGFQHPEQRPRLAVISSASSGEYAREATFSQALAHVLRVGPPPDSGRTWWTHRDREITPEELAAAVQARLAGLSARQFPEYDQTGVIGGFFPNPHYMTLPDVVVEHRKQPATLSDADAVQHFMTKFRGIDAGDERGWFFTGRTEPLRAIVTWLVTASSGMLIVTGPPGSGKSAVLGRLALLSDREYRAVAVRAGAFEKMPVGTDPGPGTITAGIYLRNKTWLDCATQLSEALDIIPPAGGWQSPSDFVVAVKAAVGSKVSRLRSRIGLGSRSLTILVDALDEADQADMVVIARDLLRGLASLPNIKVIVGMRPDRAGLPGDTSDGPILNALGDCQRLSLSDDPDREQAIAQYVYARIMGTTNSPYLDNAQAAMDVSRQVAMHATGVFLFGRLIARALVGRGYCLDPGGDELGSLLSGGVTEAFVADLARYGGEEQRVRDLLAPLAWAQGAGLPRRDVWLAVANRLSGTEEYVDADLAWLFEHAVAHIVESGEAGQTVYRLYHQAFDDYFRTQADPAATEAAITEALVAMTEVDGRRDWRSPNPYLPRHLPAHASAARRLLELVDDAAFMACADPDRLVRALESSRPAGVTAVWGMYSAVLHRLRTEPDVNRRASYLELSCRQAGLSSLADRFAIAHPVGWRTPWARWLPDPVHEVLGQHYGVRQVLSAGRDRGCLLITAGDNGAVVWDRQSAIKIGELTDTHWNENRRYPIHSIGLGGSGANTVIAAAVDREYVRIFDLNTRLAFGEPLRRQGWSNIPSCVATIEDSGVWLIAVGFRYGQVYVWRHDDGFYKSIDLAITRSNRIAQLSDEITVLAFYRDPDSRLNLLIGTKDGRFIKSQVMDGWRSALFRPPGGRSVAAWGSIDLQGRTLVATSNRPGRLQLWNIVTRKIEHTLYMGLGGGRHQRYVALGHTKDDMLLVGVADLDPFRSASAWVLDTAGLFASIQIPRGLQAVGVAELKGRPALIGVSYDGIVRSYPVAHGTAVVAPPHNDEALNAYAFTFVEEAGRSVLVSAHYDGPICRWDLASGSLIGPTAVSLKGFPDFIEAGELDGVPVLIAGSSDGFPTVIDRRTWTTVRLNLDYKLETGSGADISSAMVLGGRWVMGYASSDFVGVVDMLTGEKLGGHVGKHQARIFRMDLGVVDGEAAVATSSGSDLYVCKVHSGRVLLTLDTPDGVSKIKLVRWGDRTILLIGCMDGTVKAMSLDGQVLFDVNVGECINGIAGLDNWSLIIGTDKGIVRLDRLDCIAQHATSVGRRSWRKRRNAALGE